MTARAPVALYVALLDGPASVAALAARGPGLIRVLDCHAGTCIAPQTGAQAPLNEPPSESKSA